MLAYLDGLFYSCYAAYFGAVVVAALFVTGAYALQECNALGLIAVGVEYLAVLDHLLHIE